MLVDYHTHHYRCGHAEGQLDAYVEAAITAGLDEIGLSDHSPIYHLGPDPQPRPRTAMSQHELPAYVAEMEAVRERFAGRIPVRLGVESDYVLGWDEHYRALWRQFPLDYVIGSVHWLGGWSIFDPNLPPGRTPDDIYAEYLHTTQAAARSGAYNIIGHLDCLKTSGHIPDLSITPLLEETVRVLVESNVVVELNTSGWRKSIADCYPRAELLACCHHYGVPVTLSSDAHAPQHVAGGYAAAVELLRAVGYREIAVFAQRERRMVPLG
ncbi:MAG: histidinol-phosphatase HisJ family protein [Chloroflexota bacterium]|nr:histidinol-phosphatase HisJ family protein [Chloroflexota bacterium]PLS80641.1 MAG: histidinol phosphate phosphatase [Chloroflexota bacterium]